MIGETIAQAEGLRATPFATVISIHIAPPLLCDSSLYGVLHRLDSCGQNRAIEVLDCSRLTPSPAVCNPIVNSMEECHGKQRFIG